MAKYHKNISFEHEKLLNLFLVVVNASFKSKDIRWTMHAKNRLRERISDIKELFYFFDNISIDFSDIIEYTFLNNGIEKILIRKSLNTEKDIILSINRDMKVVTLYINNASDNHITLNKNAYCEA